MGLSAPFGTHASFAEEETRRLPVAKGTPFARKIGAMKMRCDRFWILLASLLAVAGCGEAPDLDESGGAEQAIDQSPEGDVVRRWVEHGLDAVRTESTPTPDAGRLYAMLTIAMYDAVNGID